MNSAIRYSCDSKLESKRPYLRTDHAAKLAKTIFHLNNIESVKEFESYDDRNFYMRGRLNNTDENEKEKSPGEDLECQEFVFKVLNFAYSENTDLVEAYTAVMLFLKSEGFRCPCPVKAADKGSHYVKCTVPWKEAEKKEFSIEGDENSIFKGKEKQEGEVCAVWLLEYVRGKGLHEFPCNAQVLNQCGEYLAKLHISLQKFFHAGFDRPNFIWDIRKAPNTVPQYLHVLKDEKRIQLVKDGLKRFSTEVLPKLNSLPKQIIHGDWNEHNILASKNENGQFCVTGFLDIGDTSYSYRVLDVAIAMMYFCHLENALSSMTPVEAAGHILAGYQSVFPLSESEISLLHASIAARFCQSLVFGEYMHTLYPEDEYVLFSANIGWKIFEEFLKLPREEVLTTWKNMCIS